MSPKEMHAQWRAKERRVHIGIELGFGLNMFVGGALTTVFLSKERLVQAAIAAAVAVSVAVVHAAMFRRRGKSEDELIKIMVESEKALERMRKHDGNQTRTN